MFLGNLAFLLHVKIFILLFLIYFPLGYWLRCQRSGNGKVKESHYVNVCFAIRMILSSSRIDAWTIRRLRELKNCYSRASGLILRQIASETFRPEISTRYLFPFSVRSRPSLLSFPQFDSQNFLGDFENIQPSW